MLEGIVLFNFFEALELKMLDKIQASPVCTIDAE